MDPGTRVCPFCGEPPGTGVFCAGCGRNLAGVAQLPTAEEWGAGAGGGASAAVLPTSPDEATAAFLDAMRGAGNPGAAELPVARRSRLRRAPAPLGWVVRPVDREDFEQPKRYEPGLVLTVEGRYHRLDSELRGWGQRDFPHYSHTASADPVEPPRPERLSTELAGVLAANGVAAGS